MQEQYTPQDIHDWKFASELSEYTLPVFPDKDAAQLILIRKAFPDKSGVLEKYGVKVIGVKVDAIVRGEDRIEFK